MAGGSHWNRGIRSKATLTFLYAQAFCLLICFSGLGHSGDPDDPEVSALGSHIISSVLRACGASQAGPLSSGSRVSISTDQPISTINLLFYLQKSIGRLMNDVLSEGILWVVENRE
jgi:hypothetical protein